MKFTIDKLSSYTIASYKVTFEGAATVVKTSGASFSDDEMTLTLTNAELASLGEDNVDVRISFVMTPTQYLCTEKFKMAVEDTDSGYVLYFSKYNDKEYVSLQTDELAGLQLDNDFAALFSYTDNAITTHNASTTAHSDIRTKIGTDISTHNASTAAHSDIRTKITNLENYNSHMLKRVWLNNCTTVVFTFDSSKTYDVSYIIAFTAVAWSKVGMFAMEGYAYPSGSLISTKDIATGNGTFTWSHPSTYVYKLTTPGAQSCNITILNLGTYDLPTITAE